MNIGRRRNGSKINKQAEALRKGMTRAAIQFPFLLETKSSGSNFLRVIGAMDSNDNGQELNKAADQNDSIASLVEILKTTKDKVQEIGGDEVAIKIQESLPVLEKIAAGETKLSEKEIFALQAIVGLFVKSLPNLKKVAGVSQDNDSMPQPSLYSSGEVTQHNEALDNEFQESGYKDGEFKGGLDGDNVASVSSQADERKAMDSKFKGRTLTEKDFKRMYGLNGSYMHGKAMDAAIARPDYGRKLGSNALADMIKKGRK